jgi:ADP-ribosylglycohydrolase
VSGHLEEDDMRYESVLGSMLGLAYGDALGKPTEFMTVARITARYGPGGPRLLPAPALVTDDTQMALATVAALARAAHGGPGPNEAANLLGYSPDLAGGLGGIDPVELTEALEIEYLAWSRSPENTRAPGGTCMSACRRIGTGKSWLQASVLDSKGCGANMRVTPLGLIARLSEAERAGAAQLQAAITHGHPTGLAAADLTAHAVWLLAEGTEPALLLPALFDYIERNAAVYHREWLGPLWAVARASSPKAYIAAGWQECHKALTRLEAALAEPSPNQDPCLTTGDGWVAEEALATALHCFLLFPDKPVTALARAATTRGDSDSLAAITGALAGARAGAQGFPPEWAEQIEYADRLTAAAALLAA